MEKLIEARLKELSERLDKAHEREKETITVKMDGDEWNAHRESFTNLQESHSTFAPTAGRAFNKLLNEEHGARIILRQEQMNLEFPGKFTHIYHKELRENGHVGEQTTIV